jgi:hypothetical protein
MAQTEIGIPPLKRIDLLNPIIPRAGIVTPATSEKRSRRKSAMDSLPTMVTIHQIGRRNLNGKRI